MKTIPHLKALFAKRSALIALLIAAPLGAMAQYVVFTDNFNHGSTTNHVSVPGGTPFASFTSYDVAASKAATTNVTVNPGDFRIALNTSTSSGLVEVEALFSQAPITLVNNGDYINLTYIFRMTNALPTGTAWLGQGLYNSAGAPPVAGSLNNSGLSTTAGSTFATGNCANWQGYFSRFFSATNQIATRPIQNGGGTTSANQDLVSGGVATSGGFTSPGPTILDAPNLPTISLTTGSYYTISYTIVLTDSNAPTLTITNVLYSGAGTGGTVLSSDTTTATGANYLTKSFDGIALGRRETGSVLITMDVTNLTISENLAGMPGQPFDVTGGGTGCVGNNFAVGLDGSVTTNDYYLYTNGVWNGSVQTGTGSALSFGNETVGTAPLTNTVLASNTISGNTGFMLGSAVVAAFALPVITSQPIPAIVANGSVGVFSVGASGGGLAYQWYKNGSGALADGGNISGSLTSALVISPVGNGDVGSYYCVVTDGCGASTNSATNSLSLDSPANLVWQGGNPNTNWDLSVTPNFNNGSAVVFHNGDNVTFDNTSIYPNVTISDSHIAPGLITESASQTYKFSGSGHIIGPGALVMNGSSGTGTLSINNSNAYTGGTTVNGGTLLMSNLNAFGTGNITLAGGTFQYPFSPGSATGLSNNIDATGNTTLRFDAGGTFACVLDGAMSGNANATLTMFSAFANNSTTARVRMYGQFTNNANIALTSAGSTETEMAPYLSSGNQVFNGIISGTVGHFVPRGNGNAIFNNTNTFNDSTAFATGYSLFMSSGNVGFGADSVSSTPPTIDASPAGTGMVGINVGVEGGNCSFFASGGAHTIANQFRYTSTTNTVTVTFSGSNDLTLSGEFDLAIGGTDSFGTNRTLSVTSTGATTLSGVVSDSGLGGGITKTGSGALYLNGANTYSGPTTNNAGLLAGSGSIGGSVIVGTNGSIGGGPAHSIGTLTVNSLLLNGNVFIRLDKDLSPAQSNDVISVVGIASSSGTGTVTVTNIGTGALAVGDSFQIFNTQVSGAGTLSVTGGGMVWTNRLAVDGSIAVLSVAPTVATNPTNITFSVSNGTNLSLSWPGDHLGWTLQTNPVGLTSSNNWFPYPGSASVTNENLIIDRTQKNVFFRTVFQVP
jgi:autotransporter-associated beta strand protein